MPAALFTPGLQHVQQARGQPFRKDPVDDERRRPHRGEEVERPAARSKQLEDVAMQACAIGHVLGEHPAEDEIEALADLQRRRADVGHDGAVAGRRLLQFVCRDVEGRVIERVLDEKVLGEQRVGAGPYLEDRLRAVRHDLRGNGVLDPAPGIFGPSVPDDGVINVHHGLRNRGSVACPRRDAGQATSTMTRQALPCALPCALPGTLPGADHAGSCSLPEMPPLRSMQLPFRKPAASEHA